MKTKIAEASYYGKQVQYYEENGEYYRVYSESDKSPVPFVDKNQMLKDWENVEKLEILDPNLNREFGRNKSL